MTSVKAATRFIVFLGFVSFFADITYEGARGVTGPFFASLGASAAAVGFVAGAGELAGYGLRIFSGYLADRTRHYWLFTILGYTVNQLAVPLMAFATTWPQAAVLVILERTGKSIRTPARDAMLSSAARTVGAGWGFGLHAAMDQAGAFLGPLIVAAALASTGNFPQGFLILAIPAALALTTLTAARITYPRPDLLESAPPQQQNLPRAFWTYVLAAGMLAAGYADFPLIAFHLQKQAIAPAAGIPLLYSLAMGVNALGALFFGRMFDRHGLRVLAAGILLSSLSLPLVFLGGLPAAIAGMSCWGAGMGAQDAILRAGIAGMVSMDKRGRAYGIFNAFYGVMWFAGSAAMGLLYDWSILALVLFGVAMKLAAAAMFAMWKPHSPGL
ncbi:MAG: MFS transporter [Bryobacteraceae bacterium]|nr:MFS transporter [Bryobacteraceae bacterium]